MLSFSVLYYYGKVLLLSKGNMKFEDAPIIAHAFRLFIRMCDFSDRDAENISIYGKEEP